MMKFLLVWLLLNRGTNLMALQQPSVIYPTEQHCHLVANARIGRLPGMDLPFPMGHKLDGLEIVGYICRPLEIPLAGPHSQTIA